MIGDADTDLGEPGLRVEGVGLQNAGVTGQMPLGILPRTIARGLEQRRRRVLVAKWPGAADGHPYPGSLRLALAGDRRVARPARIWLSIRACSRSAAAQAPTWSASVNRLVLTLSRAQRSLYRLSG